MKLLMVGGMSSILLLGFWLFTVNRGHHRGHDQVEAINNARQIGIALFEFETEYGKFPDASTVADVKRESGTSLTLSGNSSNDHFAQLIASGICQSESMFHAKSKGAVKPDGVFNSDATVLNHGECSFAYIAGSDATGHPDTPIVFGPVIPGTTTLDTKIFDGKGFLLRKDNSVTALSINASGRIIHKGLDLLDPRQPFWNGKTPDVKWPK